MKHPYLLFTLFITVISSGAFGQDRSGFEQNFKIIDSEQYLFEAQKSGMKILAEGA